MFRKKLSIKQRHSMAVTKPRQPVFSYYSRRETNSNASDRQPFRDNKQLGAHPWWHFVPSILALIALAVSLVYVIGLSSNPIISQPSGESVLLRPMEVYQQAAHQQFASSWLNRTKVSVNTSAISNGLLKQFPELENVSIALPLIGRRPVVAIVPSSLILLLKTQNGNFLLNQEGRAVKSENQALVSSNQLPVVIDESGISFKPGQMALPSNYMAFITTVVGQLRAKSQTITSMTLPAQSSELDVHVAGQGYIIKMTLQDDATQQIGTYLAAQQKLGNQLPSSYFDVRVPERVYFK